MPHLLALLFLATCLVLGLPLVLFGLPGLWVMVLGVIGYGALTNFHTVGLWTIVLATSFALLGEAAEWVLGFHYTRRYGGSRRAGWGAIIGGLIGAGAGTPIPVVGSIVGAFVGSFVGAAAFEYVGTWQAGAAVRVAWGALLGRAAGAAAKVALGIGIAVLGVMAAVRG